MFKKSLSKKITLFSTGLLLFSSTSILTVAEEQDIEESEELFDPDYGLNKTPTITADNPVVLADEEPVDVIKREEFALPENYPEDLKDIELAAEHYILIDQETERVLAAKDATDPYPIASMSKIMPAYLTYKAVEEGIFTMDDVIEISQEIEDYYSFNPESSSVGLHAGINYPVEDLLAAVMILSANDATAALMWEIYGSEEAAVQAIRNQLHEWGLTDFEFYASSGFPNKYLPASLWVSGSGEDDQNVMSAADVALMTKKVVEEYPQLLELTAMESYDFMTETEYEQVLGNSNRLLPGFDLGREGVTGLKSGFTDSAGKCFVTTTTEHGREQIAVVMNVPDMEELSTYEETHDLLEVANKHQDLYKEEALPTISLPTLAERQAAEEAQAAEDEETTEKAEQSDDPRNSPITKFIRKIKNFF